MYTLCTTSVSSNRRKVTALTHPLDLSPQLIDADVYRGEGRAPESLFVNPWGRVPALRSMLGFLELHLAQRSYLVGEKPSLADFFMIVTTIYV